MDVSAILLDAGGVLVFPRPGLVWPSLRAAGLEPDLATLERAHYHAMLAQDVEAEPPAPGTWWRNYMQTYFGVTPQQSVASGFAVYTPKAGLQRVDVGVGAEYKLSATLKLKTQLGGSRLCRIAERSPIVAKPTSGVVSVGLSYVF